VKLFRHRCLGATVLLGKREPSQLGGVILSLEVEQPVASLSDFFVAGDINLPNGRIYQHN